jgi:hypothetical protein
MPGAAEDIGRQANAHCSVRAATAAQGAFVPG